MAADVHGYSNTLRVLLTQFNDETLIASSSTLAIVSLLFVGYWFYNRKKFHQLGHQIPAAVVKNYLDSIIQNSSSLKSALFRGGGLDVDPSSIPAVLPLSGLRGGDSVGVGANAEELSQKNAQISSLTARLNEKTAQVGQIETQLSELNGKLKDAQSKSGAAHGEDPQVPGLKAKIKELEDLLAKMKSQASAASAGGGDDALKAELAAMIKERDALKERLAEYEIIEDDLANLKRLQQENEQLKKSMASLGGGTVAATVATAVEAAPPDPTPEPEPEPTPEPEPEPTPEAEATESAPVEAVAGGKSAKADLAEAGGDGDSGGVPSLDNAEAKSAEDLLNEFEKMLGS